MIDDDIALRLVAAGTLRSELLVTGEISLDEAGEALANVGRNPDIVVITRF